MFGRILQIVQFNQQEFDAIYREQGADGQVLRVVAAVALLWGIGSGLYFNALFSNFFAYGAWAFLSWLLWSFIIGTGGGYIFGLSPLPDRAGVQRVVGYAHVAWGLMVLQPVPVFGRIIPFIAAVLLIAFMFRAIQTALKLEWTQIIPLLMLGWIVTTISQLLFVGVVNYMIGWVL